MPLKDLLRKKERIETTITPIPASKSHALPQATPYTFVRSDTNTQEYIQPPKYASDDEIVPEPTSPTSSRSKRFGRFRNSSVTSNETSGSPPQKEHKRLSQRLNLSGNRSRSSSSANVPENLPDVPDAYSAQGDEQEKEARWEERATLLANQRPPSRAGSQISTTGRSASGSQSIESPGKPISVGDATGDANIQEAIRLHEAGELTEATGMFAILAEQGNVLSQVLFGLSLRHGWGCKPDPDRAVQYLAAAASNSAAIESEALKAGMKKGGAAKGELVLAIFELANCYRYGWGVTIDKAAARQYYETAANLGDTDAMDQAAWCYLEGFGGKKDKFKAAQLLRLAEKNGHKTLGNTWIWKEKYDPK